MASIPVEHSQIDDGNTTINYGEDDLSSIANDRSQPHGASVAASFLDERSTVPRSPFNYGSFKVITRKR